MCDTGNVFDDGQTIMQGYSVSEIKELSTDPEKVLAMEARAKAWMKRVSDVLKESEQIRKENNSSGNKKI